MSIHTRTHAQLNIEKWNQKMSTNFQFHVANEILPGFATTTERVNEQRIASSVCNSYVFFHLISLLLLLLSLFGAMFLYRINILSVVVCK